MTEKAQAGSSRAESINARRLFASEIALRLDNALPSHNNPDAIKRAVTVLEKVSRAQQNQVLHWVEVAAQSSFELAVNIALLAQTAVMQLDHKGFEAWVLGGLERKDKQGIEQALIFLSDIGSFVEAYRESAAVANFAEVEPRTYYFLQAISGEPQDIRADAYAWTDTSTLFLPKELAALPSAAANRQLYKVMAILLWAQTKYGTFLDADKQPSNVLLKYAQDERALRWLAALEAVRLEGKLKDDYPGLVAEIASLRGPWPEALAAALPRLYRADATLADTVAVLEEFMADDEAESPYLVHAVAVDPATTLRAIRAQQRTDGKQRFGAREEAIEEEDEDYAEGDGVGQGVEIDQPPGESTSTSTHGGHFASRDEGNLNAARPVTTFDEPDFKYHEWDYRRGVYKDDWCSLYEVPVAPGDPAYVDMVKRKYRVYIQQIRRQLELIKGEDRVMARQVDGEELDLDAVVESFIEHRSGGEPSDRLFRRRVRNERSLAVMFMVDMSGSTKGWVNNAERESLILLCEALELLNDNYAIYGFSGYGRERCEIYPIKLFDEQYTDAVRARIAGIEGKDYTRMGVAIRHLSHLLEQEPARHKLLITISDGYPDDYGDDYRSNYGIEDTRRALQEAHERGIRSFCVTIDRQGADYLERLYGPAHYEVVPSAHRLPLRMAEIYRHLTT